MLKEGSKIYLAGPMRGYELYNFPTFDKAAEQLRSYGHQVISPAEIDREFGFDPAVSLTDNFPRIEDCLRRDIEAIIWSEALMLLPGWSSSEGAMMEKTAAQFLHREIYLYNPDYPGRILDFPYIKRPHQTTACIPKLQFA